MRNLIASFKIFCLIVICLGTIPLQALDRLFLSKSKLFFIVPFFFHRSLCRVFGIRLRIQGTIETDKQVVYVSNHLSYLDIPLLGSFLRANFVSKDDVQSWPVLGLLASLSKTIFISRSPSKALKSIEQMQTALNEKRSLIVFPEGTSSNGMNVKPFKSSFFDIFLKSAAKDSLFIQPFSIGLIKVNDDAVKKESDFDLYAWYDDMALQPHIWTLAKSKGVQLLVRFHDPIPVKAYENRKKLSKDCYDQVAQGLDNIQKEFLKIS